MEMSSYIKSTASNTYHRAETERWGEIRLYIALCFIIVPTCCHTKSYCEALEALHAESILKLKPT